MKRTWWKEAVAYEIYPRSFKDTNADGIGDLQGVISKLDYLKDLGIDVIWICPFYKSPNDDNGYDISDYQDIIEEFGTIDDFNELLKEVHSRDMKLIIDLVVNHTSDEHPWFIESSSSKNNPKRDWYIWRDGKEEKEPNNWESIFGGSAWKYNENTEQYYLHLFSKKQPDLNWENSDMRRAVYDMINWWLDKGIDGFRVDAISHIKKEEGLKDMPNPKGLEYVEAFDKHMNVDGIHKYLGELKKETFSKYDIMTVGEANGVNIDDANLWVGEDEGKFNMVFQFEHIKLWESKAKNKFDIINLKKVLSKWQTGLEGKGWNALYIENHDIPRSVSIWGNDKEYLQESAKALAAMYFMMKGTPFIYQGQEIGMTNVKFDTIYEYNDIKTINTYFSEKAKGISHEEIMKNLWGTSRDNSRTPMQWDSSLNGGFSEGKPWIGLNPNYKDINVKKQKKNEKSILNFYKKMIKLKKQNDVLIYGKYKLILEDDKQIFAYTRSLGDEEAVIICNLSDHEAVYEYKGVELEYGNLVLNNYETARHDNATSIELKPYETRVYLNTNK